MKAVMLIVLLHFAIAQKSDEVTDRRGSRLDAGLQQLVQAFQLIAQHPAAMGEQLSAMGDRISAMEGQIANITEQMTAEISPQEQHQTCDLASSIVREFNQLHLELLDRDSRAVDSKLLEMRQIVQSAVDHVSATEERIAASNSAMKENLVSNMTSLMAEFLEQMDDLKDRINATEAKRVGTDCKDLMNKGFSQNGLYTIRAPFEGTKEVYCDMENDGGGWLVFQRRMDGSQDFQLGWERFASGFCNLTGEFWLGNRMLFFLTGLRTHELKVELRDWEGQSAFAHYDSFKVGRESAKFPLSLGTYSGNAGDSMSYNNGKRFSTIDQDNDDWSSGACTSSRKSAWWHGGCTDANLNALYLHGDYSYSEVGGQHGVYWYPWRNIYYSLKFTELKMRPL